MWREPPKRARTSRARAAPSRAISASPAGGSVTMPVRTASRSWRNMRSAPPDAALLALQLAQHGATAFEVPAEDAAGGVEELSDGGVAHRVTDGGAFLASLDHVLGAQDRQMLRDDRLIEGERLLQLLHALLAMAEDLENADPGGVAERLEEVRLQGLQLEPARPL